MIIMKFGGSSLTDPEHFLRAAHLVAAAAAERTPCVVLSAPGDATDELFAAAQEALGGALEAAQTRADKLFARFASLRAELLPTESAAQSELHRLRDDLRLLLLGASRRGKETDESPLRARATDAIIAHGERAATALLHALLVQQGHSAVCVDARDVIRTDGRFGQARPNTGEIRQLSHQSIGPQIAHGTIVITQGFVGRGPDGSTTTLGRGGSDWTATLLGAALAAEEVQIWTDVEGVHTADPRIVGTARPVPELSPDEAAELAAFGARVLHPSTMKPAVDRGIPVTVRHAARPEGAHTRIVPNERSSTGGREDARRGIVALASRGPVAVLTMTSRRMLDASGYLARLFAVFGELEVSIDLLATAEVSVACTVEADAPIAQLMTSLDGLAHVDVQRDLAIVAVVGDGLQKTPHMLERASRALHPIEPALVSYGGNSRNLSFVVPQQECDAAIRRLHTEFFDKTAAPTTNHPSSAVTMPTAQP
ncbi:MAG: aspartate kinase [Planctomycetota bacterium]